MGSSLFYTWTDGINRVGAKWNTIQIHLHECCWPLETKYSSINLSCAAPISGLTLDPHSYIDFIGCAFSRIKHLTQPSNVPLTVNHVITERVYSEEELSRPLGKYRTVLILCLSWQLLTVIQLSSLSPRSAASSPLAIDQTESFSTGFSKLYSLAQQLKQSV
jgi:hypothetical protein